jgi:hypothetical protein
VAALVLIAPAAAAGALAHELPGHTVDVSRRFAAECADVEALNVAAGQWIDAHLPPGAVVATHDAGAIRYFGRRPVLDLWGNNDHELNALPRRAVGRARHRHGGPGAARDRALPAAQAPRRAGGLPRAVCVRPQPRARRDRAPLPARGARRPADRHDFAAFFGLTSPRRDLSSCRTRP